MFNYGNANALDHSFKISQQIMKKHSRSFYQAFNLLPIEMFNGVSALYAYNRYVDDLVDNNDSSEIDALACLDCLENTLILLDRGQEIIQNEFTQLEWWPAFTYTVTEYEIPVQALIDQIVGQRLDLHQQVIDSLEDLIYYAEKVAGSVGLMLLPILVKDRQQISPALKAACQHLGIAMQLTNILRDVGEDYRDHNRIYLPKQLMVKHHVTSEDIGQLAEQSNKQEPVIPDNVINLWEEIASYSTKYYEEIHNHIEAFHPKARLPLIASASIYQSIETVIREDGYNCFTKRQYTSKLKRTQLIQQAHQTIKRS